MVDGGTRFALDVEPGLPEAAPAFRALLDELGRTTSRDEDGEHRKRGGRVVDLPMPQLDLLRGGTVAASVQVSGTRREVLVLYIEDIVRVKIGIESGEVRVELKARALWAEGVASIAQRWLQAVLWWTTGKHASTLDDAHVHGWRTTNVELCGDYVGFDFVDEDLASFVGFSATEVVRKFSRDGKVETLNFGTRSSPVSLCIYDKDEQVAKAKKGDDSTYRSTHIANGWDGVAPRRRVEFRVRDRALQLVDENTGEVLDFRNPATLADREARCRLWAVLCTKKRLVMPGTATRFERSEVDARWLAVVAASGQSFEHGFRQTREAQCDAWHESARRARRDSLRALARVAALHDRPDASPHETLDFIEATANDELDEAADYAANYRARREAFLGPEIRGKGRDAWAAAWARMPAKRILEAGRPSAADLIERCTQLAFERAGVSP